MLLDRDRDADLGELRLDRLRGVHPFRLVEDVERAVEAARHAGLGQQRLGLVGIVAVEVLVAMADQARAR